MSRQERRQQARNNPEHAIRDMHGPYWMRAHRDWRFLAVVFVMLGAMLTYLFTSDLAWRPHHRLAQPVMVLSGP
jgi:hypothetical protein